MNPETFPYRVIREFASSKMVRKSQTRFKAVECSIENGGCGDHTATTYHRTLEVAQKVAKSNMSGGYPGILKSGKVEENK
jgi:hypothetical protein